jgi:hypothetical protein
MRPGVTGITGGAARQRGRRVTHWSFDWGSQGGLHVFCAVLAWSRFRFVRFAAGEKAATTLAMLAECIEVLGGAPNGRPARGQRRCRGLVR